MLTDGQDYERTFPTSVGPVGVLAEIEVHGDRVLFKNLSIYPTMTAERLYVGFRQMREIFRAIEAEAAAEGFREYLVLAKRISGAAPGRMIEKFRRLR